MNIDKLQKNLKNRYEQSEDKAHGAQHSENYVRISSTAQRSQQPAQ